MKKMWKLRKKDERMKGLNERLFKTQNQISARLPNDGKGSVCLHYIQYRPLRSGYLHRVDECHGRCEVGPGARLKELRPVA